MPAERLEAALELLAEVIHRPTFPAREVDRLRDERLNDLLQARADPRRRADEVFTDTIYTAETPYHRPAGGTDETVRRLDRSVLEATYRAALDPARTTVIVAGEVGGIDVEGLVDRLFGSFQASAPAPMRPIVAESALSGRRVRVIHRPGSVQSELRVGHLGVARRFAEYHALSVTGAILGGLFNSRLNMKLREEKGYTYGAGAGWDLRRGPGPFGARAAVNSEVTVPALDGPARRAFADPRGAGRRQTSWRPRATTSSACSRSGSRRRQRFWAQWRAWPSTNWPTTS